MNKIILPEIISIGVYDAAAVFSGKITKNRRVSVFEIELPIEYGGTSYTDDESVSITPDTVICAKPGQQRHTELPFRCLYAHIMLDNGFAYEALKKTPSYFKPRYPEKYRELFNELCELYATGLESDMLLLQGRMLELIYMIHSDTVNFTNKGFAEKKNDYVIEEAIEFINNNFTRQLNLDDIAESVSLSPIYFHHRFKAATGETPHDYLTGLRIKKAVNLLMTTDLSLAQIAYECGFSSQSYFSYVFKKAMNATPREYMRKMYERYSQ